MSPKFGEKSPMSTAEVMGVTREMAGELVEREKRSTGSLMVAYRNVGKSVGVTPDWIRKFVKGSSEVKEPRTTSWLNIILLHQRIIARIDQAAANERAKSAALREQLNAAMGGNLERGCFVAVDCNISYYISRDALGLARIAAINRRKRSDPVVIASRSGRDVIDVRSRKPWHPDERALLNGGAG